MEALAAVLKAAAYAAALSAAGIVFARATLLKAEVQLQCEPGLRLAGTILAVAAFINASLLFLRLGGAWDPPILRAMFMSPLGLALGLQLIGGLWLALGLGHRLIAAFGIVLAFAVSGHAAARGVAPATIVAGHVAAAAWWLGGLWLLLALRRAGPQRFLTVVDRFSAQAVWIVGGLVVAGLVEGALLLDGTFDVARPYDRTLAVKVALALALLFIAAGNRFVLRPRLAERAARSLFSTSMRAEIILIAAILATTAYLTTFHGPHSYEAPPRPVVASLDGMEVIDAWVAATPPDVTQAAAYLTLRNTGAGDRLLSASSPRAAEVTLHRSAGDEDIASMRATGPIDLPSGSTFSFTPGDRHIMLSVIDAPFVEGETIMITLHFEKRGDLTLTLPIRRSRNEQHIH